MKFNTLFVAAICAGTLFNSCVDETAKQNQLKYTHTTLVDGEAYVNFHKIGETALTGVKNAEEAENSADAKSKEVAAKVKAFYNQLIPALETLATANQVDFPIKGIPAAHAEVATDSTAHAAAHVHADYVHTAQHEIALVKEQLGRLAVNTNADLKAFGKEQGHLAAELFAAIGGKEDAHAHH